MHRLKTILKKSISIMMMFSITFMGQAANKTHGINATNSIMPDVHSMTIPIYQGRPPGMEKYFGHFTI